MSHRQKKQIFRDLYRRINQQRKDPPVEPLIFAIATAHLDTQWNWDVRTTIRKYLPDTLQKNFDLMERYPHYLFNFEGAFRYDLIKEYYPKEFDRLKKYVACGRWYPSGAGWDANDVLIPSEESILRNFLYGNRFFEKEFGLRSQDVFLPDCFGFSQALPTIAAHMGLQAFSTQKLYWSGSSAKVAPFQTGKWFGTDGSVLYAALNPGIYETTYDKSLSAESRFAEEAGKNGTAVSYYGTGDIGGSPTEESVRIIHEDVVKGKDELTGVRTISATSAQFAEALAENDLESYQGDLLMRVHGTGCYSSRAVLKHWSKLTERMAFLSEELNLISHHFGGVYPQEILETAWKRFLWHHFHDDITGTSVPSAYEISENDLMISFEQFSQELCGAMRSLGTLFDTSGEGVALISFNPLPFDRQELLEAVVPEGDFTVFTAEGREIVSQRTEQSIVFRDLLPAAGFKIYYLRSFLRETADPVQDSSLQNDYYEIRINENGEIEQIYDKEFSRRLLSEPIGFEFFEDNSEKWPSWEILYTDLKHSKHVKPSEIRIRKTEQGAIRETIEVRQYFGETVLSQTISLTKGIKRIDVKVRASWNEQATLLKLKFPWLLADPEAVYDLGAGVTRRDVNTADLYETPLQDFLDVSDGHFGISVLTEKTGFDRPSKNIVRMTVFHTPKGSYGDNCQNLQDLGEHEFRYAIFSHSGDYRRGVLKASESWKQPARSFFSDHHEGPLTSGYSFLKIPESYLRILSIKKAEDSDQMILRLQEMDGKEHPDVAVQFSTRVLSVFEVNGMEDQVPGKTILKGNAFHFSMKPFELKTFMISLKDPGQQVLLPFQKPLDIVFNSRFFERKDDEKGFIPESCIRQTVSSRGISYRLAAGHKSDALKAEGQKFMVPEGYQYLSLILTSLSGDREVIFDIDSRKQKITIPAAFEAYGSAEDRARSSRYSKKNLPIVFHTTKLRINGELRPYTYTNFYRLDLVGRKIRLPKDSQIVVLSATAVKGADVQESVALFEMPQALEAYDTMKEELNEPLCQSEKERTDDV